VDTAALPDEDADDDDTRDPSAELGAEGEDGEVSGAPGEEARADGDARRTGRRCSPRHIPRQASPTTRRRIELLNRISQRGLPGERVLKESRLAPGAGAGVVARTSHAGAVHARITLKQARRMSAAISSGKASAIIAAAHAAALVPVDSADGDRTGGDADGDAAGFGNRSLKGIASLRGAALFREAEGTIESKASQDIKRVRIFTDRCLRRFQPMPLAQRLHNWATSSAAGPSQSAQLALKEKTEQHQRRDKRRRRKQSQLEATKAALAGTPAEAAAGVVSMLVTAQAHRPKVIHGVALMQAAAAAAKRGFGLNERETDAIIARTGAPSAAIRAKGKEEIRQASFRLLSGKRRWGKKLRAAAAVASILSHARKQHAPPPPVKRPPSSPSRSPDRTPRAPLRRQPGAPGSRAGSAAPDRAVSVRDAAAGVSPVSSRRVRSPESDYTDESGSVRSYADSDAGSSDGPARSGGPRLHAQRSVRFADGDDPEHGLEAGSKGDGAFLSGGEEDEESAGEAGLRSEAAQAAREARRRRLDAKSAIMKQESGKNAAEEAMMRAIVVEAGERLLDEGPGGRRADSAIAWVEWRRRLLDEKPEARAALMERVKRHQGQNGGYLDDLRADFTSAGGKVWRRPPELPLKVPLDSLIPEIRTEHIRRRAQLRADRTEDAKIKAVAVEDQRRQQAEARFQRLSLRREEERRRERLIWWAVLVKVGASARVMGEQATFARLRNINQMAALFVQRVWRGKQAREWVSRFRHLRPILSRYVWRWRLGRRIAVRNRAADRIAMFTSEFCVTIRSERVRLYTRRFMDRVRAVQHRVRQHQASNAARCVMLATWWRVVEQRLQHAMRRHRERSQQERLTTRLRVESAAEAKRLQKLLQRTITGTSRKTSITEGADGAHAHAIAEEASSDSEPESDASSLGGHMAKSQSRVGFSAPKPVVAVVSRATPARRAAPARAAGPGAENRRPSVMRRRGRLPPTLQLEDSTAASNTEPALPGPEEQRARFVMGRDGDSQALPAIAKTAKIRSRHAVLTDVLSGAPGGIPFTPAMTARSGVRSPAFDSPVPASGASRGVGVSGVPGGMLFTPMRPAKEPTHAERAGRANGGGRTGSAAAHRDRGSTAGPPTHKARTVKTDGAVRVGRWDLTDRRVVHALEAPVDAATRMAVVKTYLLRRLREHATEVGLQRLQAVRAKHGDQALTLLSKQQAMKIRAKRLEAVAQREMGTDAATAAGQSLLAASNRKQASPVSPPDRPRSHPVARPLSREEHDDALSVSPHSGVELSGSPSPCAERGVVAPALPGMASSASSQQLTSTVTLVRSNSTARTNRTRQMQEKQSAKVGPDAITPRSSPGAGESDAAASAASQLRQGAMQIASRNNRRRRSSLFAAAAPDGASDEHRKPGKSAPSQTPRTSPTSSPPTPGGPAGLFEGRAPRLETGRDVRLALRLVPPDSEIGREAAETAKSYKPVPLRLLATDHHMDVVGMMVEAHRLSAKHG
jgi:hypothetical protein